jgi:cysteine desulfurase
VPFLAQLDGGGQERQRRSGTENVPGIVGTAVALEIAQREREIYAATCRRLRDRLIEGAMAAIPSVTLNGHRERRLPNNASLAFEGADARRLVELLDEQGIACSAGSACAAQVVEPSHVLMAMGLPLERALGTVRFSLSAETTDAEIDRVLAVLPGAVERARRESTLASAAV